MIVDYLIQAMDVGYNPATDPDNILAVERVAVFRLFLWADLIVTPTVLKQLAASKNSAWRDRLERLVLIHLPEAQIPASAFSAINDKVQNLQSFHCDSLDCRILAEAESIGANTLLSFDHQLRRRLKAQTTLSLCRPSDYWNWLAIRPGTRPKWAPALSNPISRETWWLW